MRKLLFTSLFLSSFVCAFGFDIPKLNSRVNDYANVIGPDYSNKIEELLKKYDDKTGAQIFVLTVPDLNGAPAIEDYGIAVAQVWKAGQKGKDNGVILIVAIKEKKVRIEVGYGLEGVLTDADSSRIIRDVMVPAFSEGNYAEGIYNGIKSVVGKLANDSSLMPQEEQPAVPKKRVNMFFSLLFFGLFFMSTILRMIVGGRSVRGSKGASNGMWFGGFGGGFGGGGGGFGGGGGGGFGGGGASGSW